MKFALPIEIGGLFRLQVHRGPVLVSDTGWFANTITDIGMDQIGNTVARVNDHCYVGTGNAPESESDTELEALYNDGALEGVKDRDGESSGIVTSPTRYGWYQARFSYPTGRFANGTILKEVGIGRLDNGTQIFARQLIKDANGDPVEVPIQNNETLTVYYQLRTHIVETTKVEVVTIAGQQRTVTSQVTNADDSTWWAWNGRMIEIGLTGSGGGPNPPRAYENQALGGPEAGPGGLNETGSYLAQDAYVPGSYRQQRRGVWSTGKITWPSQQVGAFVWGCPIGQYQAMVDPVLTKTNLQEMRIDFYVNWARYTPP